MVTIDKALRQISDRMELWEDYGGKRGDEPAAREWLEILRMSRDAIRREQKNRVLRDRIISDLGKLNPGDTVSPDVVREAVESFDFGKMT